MIYMRKITILRFKMGAQSTKIAALALSLVLLCGGIFGQQAAAYVSVDGYYRSDGTYVKPHVRSNPNGLKYDNYSWSSGDDLYNDTYGTRGSEWDTPTYITDPQYYEGKDIYDDLNSNDWGGYSESNPSYSYTYEQDRCPDNAHANGIYCRCNENYVRNIAKTGCTKLPENAHGVDSSTDAWMCDEGYEERGSQCIEIKPSLTPAPPVITPVAIKNETKKETSVKKTEQQWPWHVRLKKWVLGLISG